MGSPTTYVVAGVAAACGIANAHGIATSQGVAETQGIANATPDRRCTWYGRNMWVMLKSMLGVSVGGESYRV